MKFCFIGDFIAFRIYGIQNEFYFNAKSEENWIKFKKILTERFHWLYNKNYC